MIDGPTKPMHPALAAVLGAAAVELRIDKGTGYAMFAYDIGFAIDLDEAERRIEHTKQREAFRRQRRTPPYFEYRPAPLRITAATEAVAVADFETEAAVDFVLYDFGAVSVTYRIPLRGTLFDLRRLSDALYDNELLLADSRRGVERMMAMIAPAVVKAHLADLVEDYVVYQIAAFAPAAPPKEIVRAQSPAVAQILRAAGEVLSQDEVDDALSCCISFAADDLSVIDWNAALLFDGAPEDVLTVLEYANVELLEMRFLDDRLDAALSESYEAFSRKRPPGALRSRSADLRRVAHLQMDSALLFEGVNNALKLLGDQYLARVYRLVAQRLHTEEWDASIIRKLSTLESIYQKMSDQQSARRMEVLEWIIIALIAIEILLPFVGAIPRH